MSVTSIIDSRQQTADSRQQTADSRQQTADSRQQTEHILSIHGGVSTLLTLVLCFGMLPTVAFAENTSSLLINDVQMWKNDAADTYLVDGAFALSGTLGSGGCTAHFNRDTATLTLNGYNGSGISALTSNVCDFTVKLVGDNHIATDNFGIQSADGDITITSDSGGTLTINAWQPDYACGIASGYSSGSTNSKVKISGNASVDITVAATPSTSESYAILAEDGIFISDSASLTAMVLTDENHYGYGLYQRSGSGSGIVINTTGNIIIDNIGVGQWTHTIRSSNGITLTNVGTMTLDYQMKDGTYGGAFNTEPTYDPNKLSIKNTPGMSSGCTVVEPVPTAALTGTATITGAAKYGATLSASLVAGNNTGELSYQWKRGGSDISGATNITYELVEADIGSTITVDITSSVQTGTLTSAATATVEKADSPAAPTGLLGVKPTTLGGSDGKITGTTTSMEYSTDSNFVSPIGTACSGDEITGLTAGTYYVRVAGTTTTKAGAHATVTVPEYGSTALTGAVTLDKTSPLYGDTITATYSPGNNSGTLSYQWYSASDTVGTNSNTYTVAATDIGKAIKCVVSSSVETGMVESSSTASVGKAEISIKMDNKSVYVGDPMPTWTYQLVEGSILHNGDPLPDISAAISCTAPDTNTVGDYDITFTPGDYGNYNVSCNDGLLSVRNRPSGGGGGGGYTPPSYSLTAPDTENGSVSLSKANAKSGDTVNITVKPDKGYTLETLTVIDKNGKEIELTVNADGTHSFKMPEGKIEIKATFMEDNTMLNFFVDVPVETYYYDAVLWAAKEGITGGTDAVNFSPNDPCTRAQVVTFLWRAAGCPEPKNVDSFSDVGVDTYYAKAVAWAAEQGISGGTSFDTFSPYNTCTRGQIATFLYRFVGSPAVSSDASFGDVAADSYYADAVKWAKENGVTGGTGPDTFGPGNDCTRAQIVTFLHRYFVK